MADPFGFMKYTRINNPSRPVQDRIKDFEEMNGALDAKERREQAARCMNCGVPHCHAGFFYDGGRAVSGCPNDNLIPEWNDLLYRSEDKRAFERLTKTNPLPEFTGRVCPAPCEVACNEALHGQGVTIKDNEKFIIERAFEFGWVKDSGKPLRRNGIKIAIVGSGPAGLTAAWELNKQGYEVTVFERDDYPGGLVMYGIPNMKLPKEIVRRRIKLMEELGIKFKVNTEVGVTVSAAALKKEFQRIILTIGARAPRELDVPGRQLKGIMQAVDYLTLATKQLIKNGTKATTTLAGKRVVVIGGGDTGNDCIATAVRQGAADVQQLEITRQAPQKRLASNPWPQWPLVSKLGYGQKEAQTLFGKVVTSYEMTAVDFAGEKGAVTSMTTSKVRLFKPIAGTKQAKPVDLVLLAMGFTGAQQHVLDSFDITQIDDDYTTDQEQVYVAGDARRGPSLVIWGIHEGRMVAKAVDNSCRVHV
ncbi:glutamate synthase subunit beta [Liquorilactobacillus capillatus]|uniref:Glutamate synthase beta subunit n=1 Tax=Liquorilactobacillus capillatus DSM 19910 TaxID=1423731 RepID=A0A0R1M2C7_9LACO|nr:glutamate synthase subunit beta [Liquorilactobacillus capillatus]KRL02172.1 glutamate synthase beta subunit [Liquorilactobacillus capillatus DSM 19910]